MGGDWVPDWEELDCLIIKLSAWQAHPGRDHGRGHEFMFNILM